MIEGYNIICFANDWDSDPLSKKHIMVRLARRNRVLWINSIGNRNPRPTARDFQRMARKLRDFFRGCRRVAHNIYAFTPLVIPFHGNPGAQQINRTLLAWTLRLACRRLNFRNPITWTFAPSSAGVAGSLGERLTLYHCVDEFSEFTGTDREAILDMERRLIQASDLVAVSSSRLYELKRPYHPHVFLVTHGVELDHFRKACERDTPIATDIRNFPRPVVGFFGLIAEWVDLDLIKFLAGSRPRWSFVLLGKVDTNTSTVEHLPNVHLLGGRPYELLPGYCKGFDVAILPFALNALTLSANPLKLREYLAAGLPVVATAIPEAEKLNGLLKVGRSYKDFLNQIEACLASGQIGPQLSISQSMEGESWDDKVEELSQVVNRFIHG